MARFDGYSLVLGWALGMGFMGAWFRISDEDLLYSPAMLVYRSRVGQNLDRMVQLAGDASRLRPHVKTHKMPQVIQMKLARGITKFKAATVAEAEMVAEAGGLDACLAYQPVGPQIKRLCALALHYPAVRFSTLVDNLDSLAAIASAASAHGVSIPLWLDLNIGMNRTGIAPGDEAVSIYRRLADTPGVSAAGLHAYDGHLRDPSPGLLQRRVSEVYSPVWQMTEQLNDAGLMVPTILAAGTPTAQYLAAQSFVSQRHGGPTVEYGAGTTVLWDDGQVNLEDQGFVHAATLFCRVISKPSADLVCVDLGTKSVSSEMPQPRVRFLTEDESTEEDVSIVSQSEEHMVLRVKHPAQFPIGKVLYAIPKHVCPTVALHQEVAVVEAGRVVEQWPVVARARRLTI